MSIIHPSSDGRMPLYYLFGTNEFLSAAGILHFVLTSVSATVTPWPAFVKALALLSSSR
jgi:hypothetical protein